MKNIIPLIIQHSKNYAIMLSLSILFYLPYILHTFYNNDTMSVHINSSFLNLNPLPDMIVNLKDQYKPLYGFFMFNYLPYKIGVYSGVLVLLGVIFFSLAIYGFVNFFVPTLNKFSKLVIYLLAFCNPYIFLESGWWGQFMGQGIVSCLYLASFVLIDKYKSESTILKKIALAYGLPIFSVVFGLNFFMPSFFHFIVLAFLYVVKNHLEKPFNTVKEFFIFSTPLFVIIGLGAIVYTIEIKGLLALLDVNISDGRAKDYDLLSSFDELVKRLTNLIKNHHKVYNGLAIVNATILFILVKRHRLNIIFMLLTPVVILVSHGFFIILNMSSTQINNFPNYYLFVFLLAFILVYLKNYHLKTMLKLASISLIVFFYFCSYFFAIWGLQHEKVIKTELAKLEQVVYSLYKKGTPIFIIGDVKNWDKKLIEIPFLVKKFFSSHGYGNWAVIGYSLNGAWYGFKNITGERNTEVSLKPKELVDFLQKQGITYNKELNIFLYNGTIYVVGDKKYK